MAYSNYEGKVFRNGEHFHKGCNATIPFRREDVVEYTFHALLGEGNIRIGLRKTYPMLLEEVDNGVFQSRGELVGMQEINGYKVYAHAVGAIAAATLVDPDGTVWTGIAGYEAWDSWCEDDE